MPSMFRAGRALPVILMAGLAAGCVGSRQQATQTAQPQQSVRATVVTAPADLQLLCASEAATRFGVASDTVLPVSSSQTGERQYQVTLSVGDGGAVCAVDDDANIISLERA